MAQNEEDDDTFSLQEETLTVADLNHVPKGSDEQLGLRSGWKSERVSGSEIRQRLSALAAPAPAAVHADGASPPQSPSARPPDDQEHSVGRTVFSKFADAQNEQSHHSTTSDLRGHRLAKDRAALEDRTGDLNTGGSVESWINFLAQPMAAHRSKADGSWDITEAEQLLAVSSTAVKQHVQLPLGLVIYPDSTFRVVP